MKSTRRLLLYRIVRLIKELYPNTSTQNPYQEHQAQILAYLDTEEQLLFSDLLHTITLLNGQGRLNDHNEMISSREDLLTTFQLILPKELQLTPKILEAHEQLLKVYQSNPFTYIEACARLRTSKSTLKRLLKPLLLYGLIIKQKDDNSTRTQFQAIAIHQKTTPTIFDEAHEEWEDYKGFVEF